MFLHQAASEQQLLELYLDTMLLTASIKLLHSSLFRHLLQPQPVQQMSAFDSWYSYLNTFSPAYEKVYSKWNTIFNQLYIPTSFIHP